jgi:hypothetical protein
MLHGPSTLHPTTVALTYNTRETYASSQKERLARARPTYAHSSPFAHSFFLSSLLLLLFLSGARSLSLSLTLSHLLVPPVRYWQPTYKQITIKRLHEFDGHTIIDG